jgi:hypothetical protein
MSNRIFQVINRNGDATDYWILLFVGNLCCWINFMHQNCRIFAKLALTSTKINQKHKGGVKENEYTQTFATQCRPRIKSWLCNVQKYQYGTRVI